MLPRLANPGLGFQAGRRQIRPAHVHATLSGVLGRGQNIVCWLWARLVYLRYRRITVFPNSKPGDRCTSVLSRYCCTFFLPGHHLKGRHALQPQQREEAEGATPRAHALGGNAGAFYAYGSMCARLASGAPPLIQFFPELFSYTDFLSLQIGRRYSGGRRCGGDVWRGLLVHGYFHRWKVLTVL